MRRRLLNLTRLGDLLQTQPLIHALKARGEEVGLVCLENFAGAAALIRDVDHVAALPASAILAALNGDWRLCADGLADWVEREHAAFPADATLNLTPTLSARLFSRLLQPDVQPDGFSLDDHGFGYDSSPWATYTQAVTANRGCSPFNLVDAFRQLAEVGDTPAHYELLPPKPELLTAVEEKLAGAAARQGMAERTGFVAFQLGASSDKRRWPTSFFAALGRMLKEQAGLVPVLLGSASERGLAERYRSHGGPGVDRTGDTDLPELAATLKACRLLVTNDTGTMHLAAGLDVPLVALFMATAQPWDTGPYRENLCCLEPRLDCHPCGFNFSCPHDGACRRAMEPEGVASLILSWLETGCWSPSPTASKSSRVWLTTRDEDGFLNLVSLSDDERTDRTIWIRIQRQFYRHFLDGLRLSHQPPNATGMGANPTNATAALPIDITPADETTITKKGDTPEETDHAAKFSFSLPPLSPEKRDAILLVLKRADSLLLLAGEQGRLLGVRPSPKARQAFLATCDRVGALLGDSPDFVPLSLLWRFMLQDFGGDWQSILLFFAALRREMAALAASLS